jgi:hypothetical protein
MSRFAIDIAFHSMAFFVESLLTCYSRQAQIFLYAYEMCHLSFRINTFFLGSLAPEGDILPPISLVGGPRSIPENV